MKEFSPGMKEAVEAVGGVVEDLLPAEQMAMFRQFLQPETQAVFQVVREVVGFEMPPLLQEPFLDFHRFVTESEPEPIRSLKEARGGAWYRDLQEGVVGHVRQSFLCVLYHQSRLATVESELMGRLAQFASAPVLSPGSVMGLGGLMVLDFEYQAYVMAYRRCLDQLAFALAAFFKNKYTSFRTFNEFLLRRKPLYIASALVKVHQKHVHNFEFVMQRGGDMSVRDRIAHCEFVSAGTLNIRRDGIFLVGGGEDLNLGVRSEDGGVALRTVLSARTSALHECISEMLQEFVSAVIDVGATTAIPSLGK